MTDLPQPSRLPDPSDRLETEAWLERRSEKLADAIARSLKKVVTSAYEKFLRTLPETSIVSSLTAAGDMSAFDGIVGEWRIIFDREIVPELEETYLSGAMSAFVQSPGSEEMTQSEVESWARVTNDQAVQYMSEATNRLVGVGDTIWNDVRSRVTDAVASGMSNEDLKGEIEKLSNFSEYRADTIARTETISAYVNGDWEGAQLLGEYGPVEKVWVATGDARGREWHTELMDTSLPMDEPFDVDGEPMLYPHDPSGSAYNVVNCRCYVEFLYPGDTRPDGSVIPERDAIPQEEEIAEEEVAVEAEPIDEALVAQLRSELDAVLDRVEEPLLNFLELQKEMYHPSFEKRGEAYKRTQRMYHKRNYDAVRPLSTEANDLAAQLFEAQYRVLDAVEDAVPGRWAGVTIETRPTIVDAPPKDAKWQRARNKYVVADTPTLEMNAALRGEIEMTTGLKARAGEARFLTSGTLESDTLLSRTMNLDVDTALGIQPGSVWESKGFQSTQAGYNSSYNRELENPGTIFTRFTIRTPAGTHAADVEYGEIVLRPGSMRILSTEWDPTERVLRVLAEWES